MYFNISTIKGNTEHLSSQPHQKRIMMNGVFQVIDVVFIFVYHTITICMSTIL